MESAPFATARLPILGMDELDKGPTGTQRACLKSRQGLTCHRGEEPGEKVEVAPVCVVSNGWPPSSRGVPPGVRSCPTPGPSRRELPADRAGPGLPGRPAPVEPRDPSSPGLAASSHCHPGGRNHSAGPDENGQRRYEERSLALPALGRASWTGLDFVRAVTAWSATTSTPPSRPSGPPAPQLTLPDATARRLADERRAADETESRRQAGTEVLDLGACKGDLLDELENGLEALRAARPVTSGDNRSAPQAWWWSGCRRLLRPDEVDACALCDEADELIPAST
jgi:hypothetical protein